MRWSGSLARFQRPTATDPAEQDITYLRFAFTGTVGAQQADRALDDGIVRVCWLSVEEVRASVEQHRSPLVLQCIEDLVAGRNYPLQAVTTHPSVTQAGPAAGPVN